MKNQITGSEALMLSLLNEGVDTIFGYPGGQIMPVYDALYDYREKLNHILVRHEQGATHSAQGYARVSGKVGVALVTSGPGATNTITGIADAMLDSTPMVVIAGQVPSEMLGTDAFQETDLVGITQPVAKWAYQIRRAEDIAWAVARAFYIARSGRPGPVILDLAKDAQIEKVDFQYKKCSYIRSYIPVPELDMAQINAAVQKIDSAKKPLALIGQGVILSGAEQELRRFLEKTGIPAASTLLGLSALPTDFPLNKGYIGMHGNIAPNIKTNEADVIIAIGLRFDDRVTGNLNTYAKQAQIIHIDIDASEIGKNVHANIPVLADAKMALTAITAEVKPNNHSDWVHSFKQYENRELESVIMPELFPTEGKIKMGEVVNKVTEATQHKAVLVTDVGQNQMFATRYFKYSVSRSVVTSGGLGTMGFGIPAAIGAKIGAPGRRVCLFCGDGGFQMTIQELGTIMQSRVGVKMILMNNSYLGMVRQWQELFWNRRYSFTEMANPDFTAIAQAYGIRSRQVEKREELDAAIADMLADDEAYLLVVNVEEEGKVYPMIPAGKSISDLLVQ